jgi:hypothetical protein
MAGAAVHAGGALRAHLMWEQPIVPAAPKNFGKAIALLMQALMLKLSPDRFDPLVRERLLARV